jgi:hypothetical protein
MTRPFLIMLIIIVVFLMAINDLLQSPAKRDTKSTLVLTTAQLTCVNDWVSKDFDISTIYITKHGCEYRPIINNKGEQ